MPDSDPTAAASGPSLSKKAQESCNVDLYPRRGSSFGTATLSGLCRAASLLVPFGNFELDGAFGRSHLVASTDVACFGRTVGEDIYVDLMRHALRGTEARIVPGLRYCVHLVGSEVPLIEVNLTANVVGRASAVIGHVEDEGHLVVGPSSVRGTRLIQDWPQRNGQLGSQLRFLLSELQLPPGQPSLDLTVDDSRDHGGDTRDGSDNGPTHPPNILLHHGLSGPRDSSVPLAGCTYPYTALGSALRGTLACPRRRDRVNPATNISTLHQAPPRSSTPDSL